MQGQSYTIEVYYKCTRLMQREHMYMHAKPKKERVKGQK